MIINTDIGPIEEAELERVVTFTDRHPREFVVIEEYFYEGTKVHHDAYLILKQPLILAGAAGGL